MTIVSLLKWLVFCLIKLTISVTIGFCAMIIITGIISGMRKGKDLPDSYYDRVPTIVLWGTIVAYVVLSLFGPFRFINV